MERRWGIVLFLCGTAALGLRTLLDSQFGNGTLVYLVVPFALSMAIYFFVPRSGRETLGARFLNHLRLATILFLATSALLFEGFICVLMFMPIYYLGVSFAFLVAWIAERSGNNRIRASALPLLFAVLALEGLVPATTFERERTSSFTADSPLSVTQLKTNLARPITFAAERDWFLELFPLPDRVEAGRLGEGDIHRLHFTYRRWLVTNVHQGEMHLRIAKVGAREIETEIVRDDSYLSHYLKVHGTRIRLAPLPGGGTRIRLEVRYRRLLDPAWYFGPLQERATRQSARFFIETIVARHPVQEVR
jgi:hypothetical protein